MSYQKKSNGIVAGIGWSFAERILAQLVSLVIFIVLARILMPEDYGVLAIVNVFVAIGDALVAGGFGIALVQNKNATEIDFNSICILSTILAIIIYGILFFVAPFISHFYEMNELTLITRVLGLRLVFSAINSIQQAYVQKYMLFSKNFMISTIGAVLSGGLGIILAIQGAGVWALVVQYSSMVILNTVLLFFVIDWIPRLECSLRSIKSMWGYGSRVFLATTVDTLKDNVRSLVVGKVFSSADLAFYNQGNRFPQLLVNDIINSVGKVLLPVFSEQQDNREKNKEFMRTSVRLSSFILLPLIFGLIGIADNFILFFLTDRWISCVPYLQVLCLVYMTRSLSTVFKNSLLAIGRSDVNLFHEVVTSVLTIALIFVAAISFRSVLLVAWSYVVVAIVGTLIFSYYVIKEYSYSVSQIFRDYVPSFVLASLMALMVYFVGTISLYLPVKLVLQVILGGGVYMGLASILKMREMEYLKNYIKNKVINRKSS